VTIRPGEEWGAPGALAADAPVAEDDRAARAHLQRRLEEVGGEIARPGAFGELGLLGGDLHRTLGSPAHDVGDLRAGRGTRYPVDLGLVQVGDRHLVFLSHLVAHPRAQLRWWSQRTVSIVNGSYVGELDLGPRAHPNDGRLDLTDGRLPLGQRRQGRRRARSGSHVPHPDLTTRRITHVEVHHDRPMHLWLDGEQVGTATDFDIRCLPDALVVVA
jgi:hypothetical protein